MTLAAAIAPTNALEVFKTRAQVRAYLWAEGEYDDLADCVDELWASAARTGVVETLGVDATQLILSEAFAPYRGRADV